MTLALAMLLAATLGCFFGWTWGHHARPQPRRVWSCARCDDTAIRAEVTRFNAVVAGLDFPDPIGAACCVRAFDSRGTDHDHHCTRKDHTL